MEAAVAVFDLFVLHAVEDGPFVHGYLLPALGLPRERVRTREDFEVGRTMIAELERIVRASRYTIGVLTPAFLADREAMFGYEMAVHLGAEARRASFLPLLLVDCEPPLLFASRTGLDYRDPTTWAAETARLRAFLEMPDPEPERVDCPYPGMQAFASGDAEHFFGRRAEIDQLLEYLAEGAREIRVLGRSGCGKTSLVQAGLLPVLERGTDKLGRSLCLTVRADVDPARRLVDALEGEPTTPQVAVDALLARAPLARRVVMFVDQLEAVFTSASDGERRRFLMMLSVLRGDPRCCVVLALRSDHAAALRADDRWSALPGRVAQLTLAPLSEAMLEEAIEQAALRVGVHIEPRLRERLVADAGHEPGALGHVQATLRELWERRDHRLLRLEAYETLGAGGSGLDVVIARHGDAVMERLTASQQAIARRALIRLVAFGDGRPDTRRQQPLSALRSVGDDAAEFSRVLQVLADERLVTIGGDADLLDAVVDLAHEALIRTWASFAVWRDQMRADERRRRAFEARADEWAARGRGDVGLLDGGTLREVDDWTQGDAAQQLGRSAGLLALLAASRSRLARTRDTQSLEASKPAGAPRGANHVLAIAIDRYAHHQPLANCVRDASDIVRILTSFYEFESANVTTLFDEDATAKKVLSALDTYSSLSEHDSLVIYFAGHGVNRKGIGWWVPVDAQNDHTEYLSLSSVRDYLEAIKARHILAIVDACFSGKFFPRTRGANEATHDESFPSRYALTAGRDEVVLDGQPGGNSPFADSVKHHLSTSTGSLGAVTLGERVLQDVKRNGFQVPRHGELHIDGNRSGQFYFHRRTAAPAMRDRFVAQYFAYGGKLITPAQRANMLQHYDKYDAFFQDQTPEHKVELRRLNTLAYLQKWELKVVDLKHALARLEYYRGEIDHEYTEDLVTALIEFQTDHMMRQIDGYFGDLTYRELVTALLERGLATLPSAADLASKPRDA